MKKVLSLVLALMMVLGMMSVAFAADDPVVEETEAPATGKTMTLTGGKAGHTYTLYQIFTGDVETATTTHPASTELLNIQWGADAPNAYKAQYDTAAAAAEAAEGGDARAWAQALNLTGNGTKQVTLDADGNVVFSDLAEGYYVILDTNGNNDPVVGDYSSAIVVAVVDNVSGALKGSATTSDKKVADNNDTSKVQPDLSGIQGADWQDSADYDIGDYVPFKLTAHTADNLANDGKYHVTFQDKQSAGLAAPTSFTVEVLGKTFTLPAEGEAPAAQITDKGTKITVTRGTPATGYTFAVTVTLEQNNPTVVDEEITSYLDAECNSEDIIVKYQSQLTGDNVKIGAEGNPNEMYVTYSNNPENKDGTEEGKTKEDKVIVFTYKTTVDKVDETGTALKGADFTLYKEVPATNSAADTGANIKKNWTDAVKNAATALADDKYYVVAGVKSGTTEGSQFEFKGIDDGTYVLVETTVPTGYNPWTAEAVVVDATHTDGDTPKLTALSISGPFNDTSAQTAADESKKSGSTYSKVSGEGYAEIENNSGSTLPETGGIGTTIFYVLGSVMALGALVLLVTKRRVTVE